MPVRRTKNPDRFILETVGFILYMPQIEIFPAPSRVKMFLKISPPRQ